MSLFHFNHLVSNNSQIEWYLCEHIELVKWTNVIRNRRLINASIKIVHGSFKHIFCYVHSGMLTLIVFNWCKKCNLSSNEKENGIHMSRNGDVLFVAIFMWLLSPKRSIWWENRKNARFRALLLTLSWL